MMDKQLQEEIELFFDEIVGADYDRILHLNNPDDCNLSLSSLAIIKAMIAGEYSCQFCKHGEPTEISGGRVEWYCAYTADHPWFKACSNWELRERE